MTLGDIEQVALPSGSLPASDADPSSSEPSVEGTPTQAQMPKEVRDRLAAAGRRAAEAERQAREAAQANQFLIQRQAQLEQQLMSIGASLSADARAKEEARISQLPKEDQALERVKMLEGVVQRALTPPARPQVPAPQRPQEDGRAYAARRSQEILTEANDSFELDEPIVLEEIPKEAWRDEKTFRRTVYALANKRANGETEVATKKTEAESAPANTQTDEDKIRADERAKVMAEFGASPASPRPAAKPKAGAPATAQDYQSVNMTYNSRQGPRAQIAKLKALRGE